MSDRSESLGRREFVQGSVSAVALAALPAAVLATDASGRQGRRAGADPQDACREHQAPAGLDRAALDRGREPQLPAGPGIHGEAGRATPASPASKLIPTSGKPGVFGRSTPARAPRIGIYFMYDVKQFVPEEWSSPPLEARLVQKAGPGHRVHGPRRGQPEGPGELVPERAAWRSRPPARSCR